MYARVDLSGGLNDGVIWNVSAAGLGNHTFKRLCYGVGNRLAGRPERVGAQMSVALRRRRVLMPHRSAPMMGKLAPPATATLAKLWRRS